MVPGVLISQSNTDVLQVAYRLWCSCWSAPSPAAAPPQRSRWPRSSPPPRPRGMHASQHRITPCSVLCHAAATCRWCLHLQRGVHASLDAAAGQRCRSTRLLGRCSTCCGPATQQVGTRTSRGPVQPCPLHVAGLLPDWTERTKLLQQAAS
jgi:hypothetical protein